MRIMHYAQAERRTWYALIALAVVFVAAASILLMLFAGVIYAVHIRRDIDLNSGELRVRKYILGIKLRDAVETTPFSDMVTTCMLRQSGRRWAHVDDRVLGAHDFYNHGNHATTPVSLRKVAEALELSEQSEDVRRQVIEDVLRCLGRNDADAIRSRADQYVEAVIMSKSNSGP